MVVKSDPHMDKAVRLVRPAAPFHPPPTHTRAPLRALPPQLRCRGAQMVEAVMSAREAYQAVQVRGEKCLQNLRKRKKLALVKQEAASPDERAAKPAAVAKPADGRRRRIIFFTPAAPSLPGCPRAAGRCSRLPHRLWTVRTGMYISGAITRCWWGV